MMKILNLLLLFGLQFSMLAQAENKGHQLATNTGFTNQTKITWEEFKKGLPELCQGISSKGHYIQKDGCVFWSQEKDGNWSCLIFTQEGMKDEVFAKLIKRCYQNSH